MPKPSEREIKESYEREGLIPNEKNQSILYHVLFDDYLLRGSRLGEKKEGVNAQKDDNV